MNKQTNNEKKLFGTDGVRGIANVEPVTAETALKLGRAAAHVFKTRSPEAKSRGRHKIVVGKDTRLSGYMLENAIASGILSMGVDVILIGPLPTPGVAYIVRSLRADAGIVLTASHNAYDDNGIKFFRDDGYKLDDKIEQEIEELVFSGKIDDIRPTASAVGKAYRIDDALGRYIEFAKSSFPKGMTLEKMRIVVDVANGAAYKSTPCVLRELGAEVFVYNNSPDGTNINLACGSTHPEGLRKDVIEHRAHVGLAHDGDADRVIMCDENSQLVDGDFIMAITALDALKRNELAKKTLVATVQSNMGLDHCIKQAGGKVIRTAVGDKNVIDKMLEEDLNIGGEQSGHMIFRDYTTTGDGLISALQVLRIMKSTGRTMSQLCRCMQLFPQVNINVRVKNKTPLDTFPDVIDLIKKTEEKLGDNGRLLVRYSGTEPLCRILLEGQDGHQIEEFAKKIASRIQEKVGA